MFYQELRTLGRGPNTKGEDREVPLGDPPCPPQAGMFWVGVKPSPCRAESPLTSGSLAEDLGKDWPGGRSSCGVRPKEEGEGAQRRPVLCSSGDKASLA